MDCIEAVKFARTLDPTFMVDHRAEVKMPPQPDFVLLVVSTLLYYTTSIIILT